MIGKASSKFALCGVLLGAGFLAMTCQVLIPASSLSEPLALKLPARLIRSDQQIIEFEVAADNPSFTTRETPAGTFEVLRIPGFFSYGRPGEAQLPHRAFLVAVPQDAGYDVTVLSLSDVVFESKLIIPIPIVSVGSDGIDEESFAPSASFYSRNELTPLSPLLGVRESWMRNQRLLGIDISPVSYNPSSKTLVLHKSIRVTVTLHSGAVKSPPGRQVTRIEAGAPDALEALYRSTILNYEEARGWRARLVPRPVTQLRDSFSSSPNWCKIFVSERAIYKVTGSDLVAAGVTDLGSINPLTLKLFNGGGLPLPAAREPSSLDGWMKECAIEVFDGGDGVFNESDFILFYGMGTDGWLDYFIPDTTHVYRENLYTDKNVYWLTWGGNFVTNPRPKPIESKRGRPVTAGAFVPQYFPERLHIEKNTTYDPSLAEPGQRWEKWWYQELVSTSSGPQSYLYTFDAPQLEPAARCSLMVRLWAKCTISSLIFCPDQHQASISLNRQFLAETGTVYGVNQRMDLSAGGFQGRERDSLIITLQLPSDDLYLAWYEFFYGKGFAVDSSSFAFSSPDTEAIVKFPLTGISDTTGLRLFDVSDYFSPVQIVDFGLQNVGGSFSLEFEDTLQGGPAKHYLLVSSAGLKRPDSIVLRQFSHFLRNAGNSADYLLITHESLAQAVQGMRNLRSSVISGLTDPKATVVTTQDIYDEFSWGVEDAGALRDFIMYAYWDWTGGPRQVSYVFLAGRASYDFRNFSGSGFLNLVPTWEETYDYDIQGQLVNDDFFALLDGPGDVLTDVSIGRATIRNPGEAATILDHKIIPYVSSPVHGVWRNVAIICADDTTKAGEPPLCTADELRYWHTNLSDSLAALHMPAVLDKDKIYLNEFPTDNYSCFKSKAKQAFISSLNRGALIANYIGHGSVDQLAHEQVFSLNDVSSLSNGGRLPLFFAGSCKVAKFDATDAEGIAEKLLRQEGGGSVASVAATELVYSDQNYDFNAAYFDFVFPGESIDSTLPVGLALQAAKSLLAVSKGDTVNARKYVLIGDPAMQLAVPELEVAFQSPGADTVYMGDIVTVSGEVREKGDLAQWYNASIDLVASGSEIVRRPNRGIVYHLPGYPLFHGSAVVEQGKFEFSFVVPLDTLIEGPAARTRGYSLGSVDGAGLISPMVIYRAIAPPVDTTGPSVVLRFDNDARYVTPSATLHIILHDEHGISVTGSSASNSILLQVDRALEPADLTSAFVYSQDSYQEGRIDYVVPVLTPGPHSVLLVAHDNFGNRGTGELAFTVIARNALQLKDVINYPNPFKDVTYINFDLTTDGLATIKIFTVSGKLIRKLCEDRPVVTGNNQIKWDGLDAEGDRVANGVYLYKIDVKDAEGDKDSHIGRAAVLR